MKESDADTDLRCVIIRGAGGKAFSAGAGIRSSRKFVGFVLEAVWPPLPAAIF
jgi:enoyl-CoA hydratase/carnithine racemase